MKKDLGGMIKLRNLRRRNHPGITRWALNTITQSVFMREVERGLIYTQRGRQGEDEVEKDLKMGVMRPQAKEWQQPRELLIPDFHPVTLSSDFWPPELSGNEFLTL